MNQEKEDFVVKDVDGKGKGLFAAARIPRDKIVLEYVGELISLEEAERRETDYEKEGKDHCYMFFFDHRDSSGKRRKMCIDSTKTKHCSRFMNHSRYNPNLKAISHKNGIWFKSIKDINAEEELTFDYGERRKDILKANPWLRERGPLAAGRWRWRP